MLLVRIPYEEVVLSVPAHSDQSATASSASQAQRLRQLDPRRLTDRHLQHFLRRP
ncbi:MAG: hypothetical protein M3313_09515 [Actinomycetota bacterium]|nr:hypothetical protein [Actinomycetota bacterium]